MEKFNKPFLALGKFLLSHDEKTKVNEADAMTKVRIRRVFHRNAILVTKSQMRLRKQMIKSKNLDSGSSRSMFYIFCDGCC